MKKYKVRITQLPGKQNMAYGGQTGYGLDLGARRVHDNMPAGNTDSIRNTTTEKTDLDPDEHHVVMAEHGETFVADQDGDGELEFQNISGDYHSDPSGGTALTNKQLNADPSKNGAGAFIFSRQLKEKDPEVLKMFGVNNAGRKGMSFADLSKRYDTSGEKKILDDKDADNLAKRTAKMVKEAKEQKLQAIANRQEMLKGNPQGQPNINASSATMAYGGYIPQMMYGGTDYMAGGGQMIRRADGHYSHRGLWDNIRANEGSGKEPSKEMLEQERKIKSEMAYGGYIPQAAGGFWFEPDVVPYRKALTPQGAITPTNINNAYNQNDEFLNRWEKIFPGFSGMDNKEAQRNEYLWMLENQPMDVQEMWQKYGLTNEGKKYSHLVDMTMKDAKGRPTYRFDPNKMLSYQDMLDLQHAYVDGNFGVRQLTPRRPIAKIERPPEIKKHIDIPPPNLPPPNFPPPLPPKEIPIPPPPPIIPPPPPKDPPPAYLPYHGIQMAQTLDAFSRPVKGYFDRPFVPDFVGINGMYDEPNYDPLLSMNATKMNAMNQLGNPQAARASGSYNPDLIQGIEAETQRAKANNLNTFNTIASTNGQLYNQNLLTRANVMKSARDNNIKTREEMDIAEKLKFQNAMNAMGKMVGDRQQMQRFNMMYPQFAVTGRLWDKMPFVKGKALGSASSSSGGNSMFPSMAEWLKTRPGMEKLYASGTADKQAEIEKQYDAEIRAQRAMMMRNGNNVNANMMNSSMMDMFGI